MIYGRTRVDTDTGLARGSALQVIPRLGSKGHPGGSPIPSNNKCLVFASRSAKAPGNIIVTTSSLSCILGVMLGILVYPVTRGC